MKWTAESCNCLVKWFSVMPSPPDNIGKGICFGAVCPLRSFIRSCRPILWPRYLMNAWNSCDETDREYSLAFTYDLIRFWRSKVKSQQTIEIAKASTLVLGRIIVCRLVAWHSGRTSVFGRRTFSVLRSTCCGRVTTYVGKPSAISQPTRPT